MKEKLDFKQNILIGSLLFGLFFGAGNLIFPVQMGQLAGKNVLPATVGFLITGVGLPLVGVISAALSQSESLFDLAKPVSRIYSIFFTCALYLTIGPLFAIPRTASVAFEVGLNPFIDKEYQKIGLLDGYNTMDALASLAFAIIIISNIEKLGVNSPKGKAIETFKSGIVCLVGMSVIYASLAYMGATSLGSVSSADNGGLIMSMVSDHYFGVIGKGLLAAIVTVACLKTAIGLITACSQMFSELFPNSISYNKYAVVFTIFSFAIANFGLSKIIQLSVPVLMFLYPLAITLIILSLLAPVIHKQSVIYKWTTVFTIIAAVFDFCNALPDALKETKGFTAVIEFAHLYLPGFDYGFGWIVPAVVGFIIGAIIYFFTREKGSIKI